MSVFEVDGKQYELTRHAIERALDMDIDGCLIRAALERPANVGYSRTFGTFLYDYKDITVAVARYPTVNQVTTILWRNDKKWRKDLRRGDYGGRTLEKSLRSPRGGAVEQTAAAEA